jgi:hypothetical protein
VSPLDAALRALEDAGCHESVELIRMNEGDSLLTAVAIYSSHATLALFVPSTLRERENRTAALEAIHDIARLLSISLKGALR